MRYKDGSKSELKPTWILKGTQDENFFGFDFEFCTISLSVNAEIIRFLGKNFLIVPLWGELRLFRVVLRLHGMKKKFKIGQFIFIFQIIYNPLIFANNRFSKIRSINSHRDGFMCQSWAKMSKFIPLSLKFSLVSD
jgi:hypothetical protein